jgi:leucyl aminopeptidase
MLLGAYRFDRHKAAEENLVIPEVSLLVDGDAGAAKAGLERAAVIASGVTLARDLAHEPPNVINPLTLAEQVRQTAEANGLKYTLLSKRD